MDTTALIFTVVIVLMIFLLTIGVAQRSRGRLTKRSTSVPPYVPTETFTNTAQSMNQPQHHHQHHHHQQHHVAPPVHHVAPPPVHHSPPPPPPTHHQESKRVLLSGLPVRPT